MCTRPSTYIASSVTNRPNEVAEVTTPLYSSPKCSYMYLHLSQASTSRLASSARRSLALQCRPAASQARFSALAFLGLAPGSCALAALPFSRRRASLACASPGMGSTGKWYLALASTALMTRCTSKSG